MVNVQLVVFSVGFDFKPFVYKGQLRVFGLGFDFVEVLGGAEILPKSSEMGNQKFCSVSCSSKWFGTAHLHTPEVAKKRGQSISKWWRSGSPEALKQRKRITALNPMSNPASVEKMRKSLKGRTFLSRGGNSQLTEPQIYLSKILNNAPMEYAINTATVKDYFQSLPNCYKVDIAILDKKIALS